MSTAISPGVVVDGKYRVGRRIGEGGMGTVYEGENLRIERKVAIKVLHAHVASSPEFALRFEREARASARIGSQYVCDVLDLGDLPNGDRYLVMEYLEGESFEERLETRRLDARQLAPIAFEVLDGLGSMHQASVIHRDLKPANVFLAKRSGGRPETVKILDFGVAKIVPRGDEPGEMTSTGMMMGTPLYMSPEQARGARDVDGRTDLYAASVMFYRALTGEVPHSGDNLHELLFKIVLEDPRPILELAPDVDPAFAAIVTRGLARDPDARWPSARAYQEAIAAWGETFGVASLRFTVTLPDEPPPLRSITGGFPSERIRAQLASQAAPNTGPRPQEDAPPTPAFAKTLPVAQTPLPTRSRARINAPTPTAWAEDAPVIAKRALAEVEAKRVSDALPARAPTRTTPPQARRRNLLLGAFGVAIVGGAALGFRASHPRTVGTSQPTASAVAGSAPASAPLIPTADALPNIATAAAQTSAEEPAPVGVPSAAERPRSSAKLVVAASASIAPSVTASAPPPRPSATTTTRKFRTNIE